MIAGHIRLEDLVINFEVLYDTNEVYYTITDLVADMVERHTVPQAKFFKALAIAVHNDGEPDYRLDYPDAESIQGNIRWIP